MELNKENETTKEERDNELQQKFIQLVETMKKEKCELPNEFELYYLICEVKDRRGHGITITPYLSEEDAIIYRQHDQKWIGKYGVFRESTVIKSGTHVNLDCDTQEAAKDYGAAYNFSVNC